MKAADAPVRLRALKRRWLHVRRRTSKTMPISSSATCLAYRMCTNSRRILATLTRPAASGSRSRRPGSSSSTETDPLYFRMSASVAPRPSAAARACGLGELGSSVRAGRCRRSLAIAFEMAPQICRNVVVNPFSASSARWCSTFCFARALTRSASSPSGHLAPSSAPPATRCAAGSPSTGAVPRAASRSTRRSPSHCAQLSAFQPHLAHPCWCLGSCSMRAANRSSRMLCCHSTRHSTYPICSRLPAADEASSTSIWLELRMRTPEREKSSCAVERLFQ